MYFFSFRHLLSNSIELVCILDIQALNLKRTNPNIIFNSFSIYRQGTSSFFKKLITMHLFSRLSAGSCVLAILTFSQIVYAKLDNQNLTNSPVSHWVEPGSLSNTVPTIGNTEPLNKSNLEIPNVLSSTEIGSTQTIRSFQSQSVAKMSHGNPVGISIFPVAKSSDTVPLASENNILVKTANTGLKAGGGNGVVNWTGGSGPADWSGNNWGGHSLPGSGDTVNINNGNTANVGSSTQDGKYGTLNVYNNIQNKGSGLLISGGNLEGAETVISGNSSVTVTSGKWTNHGNVYVGGGSQGAQGTSTLTISGGEVKTDGYFNVGVKDNLGTMTMTGGKVTIGKILQVGGYGLDLGGGNPGTGSLLVNGGEIDAKQIIIARIGQGSDTSTMTVKDGIVNAGQYLFLGANSLPGGKGLVELDGGVVTAGYVGFGYSDNTDGVIKLNENALLATNYLYKEQGNKNRANFTFNGGTLQAQSDSIDFIYGFGKDELVLGEKGGIIDTNGHSVRVKSALSGNGDLNVTGGGGLILSAENTYTEITHVNTNTTLQIGDEGVKGSKGTTGSITSDVDNQGTVIFKRSNQLSYNNVISGTGTVVQAGSGETVLKGNNTYSGDTFVEKGTWSQGMENAFSAQSTVKVAKDANLNVGGFDGTIGGLVGEAGAKVTNSSTASNTLSVGANGSSTTFAGTIEDGKGKFALTKIGNGTLTLTGENTYKYGTTIEDGTLQIGDGGTTGSIQSDVINKTNLVFNRSNTGIYGGAISGEGTVVQAGSGETVLKGNNTYSGDTFVEKGTWSQGMENAFSAQSTVKVAKNANLNVRGFDGTIGGLVGEAGAKVTNSSTASNTLSVGANGSSTTFAGTIEDGKGKLALTKIGNGTLTLTGENTYKYGTTIEDGTLQIGDGGTTGSIQSDVINKTNLVFNRSNTGIYGGAISGEGTVVQAGSGETVLKGNNTYSGDTFVEKGTWSQGMENAFSAQSTVKVAKNANLNVRGFDGTIGGLVGEAGAKVTNSSTASNTLSVGANGSSTTFAGTIEDGKGKLALTKIGNGTLTLTGENTYKYGTTIEDGTLQIGDGRTTGSVQSDVKDNSNFAFNHSDKVVYNHIISGTGNVIQAGTGSLVLKADNTYTGITDIQAGEVEMEGSLASSEVNIHRNTTFSGNGSIAGNVQNSGWFKPGKADQVGTITLGHDFVQTADGNSLFKLAKVDSYDQLKTDKVANLDGGLHVTNLNHFIPPSQSEYTIVQAAGGVQGKYRAEDIPTPLQLTAHYYPDKVMLKADWLPFTPIHPADKSVPWTSLSNALLKAIALQPATRIVKPSDLQPATRIVKPSDLQPATPINNCLYKAISDLAFIPRTEIEPYLKQLAPEMAGDIKEILFNNTNTQYGQITDRLAAIRSGVDGVSLNGLSQEPMQQQMRQHEATLHDRDGKTVAYQNSSDFEKGNSGWSLFATASGVFSNIVTTQDLPNMHTITGNFSAGVDYKINDNFNTGLFVAYEGIRSDFSNGSWLRSNGIKFGGYGTAHWNGFYLNAVMGAGFESFALSRPIDLPCNGNEDHWLAKGRPSGAELDSLLGGGYEYSLGKWRFGANASIQYTYLTISSYTESGAGALDLKVGRQNPGSMMSTVGANISYVWDINPNFKIMPTIGLAWQHQFLDYAQPMSATFDNGEAQSFIWMSDKGERDNAFGTAGITAQIGNHFGLYCYYNPIFGGSQIVSHGVLFGLSYTF